VATFRGSVRIGCKTILDGNFDRLECPSGPRILEHYGQSGWCDILSEAIHIGLHDKPKRIVPCALLLEDTRDGNEESCGLLPQLREAFAVLLDGLSPKSTD
jgi:hypothetical protein